jgi:hypothetical protein
MKYIITIIVALFSGVLFASQGVKMNDYQQSIMDRRIYEAQQMWEQMQVGGFTETTVVALDFVFFSNSKPEADNLIEQLSENYTLELTPSNDPKYVLVKGTTRPYGNEFNEEQWQSWVKFMVSVGFSHNSVFSTWSVNSPKTKTSWSSEPIEAN